MVQPTKLIFSVIVLFWFAIMVMAGVDIIGSAPSLTKGIIDTAIVVGITGTFLAFCLGLIHICVKLLERILDFFFRR